MRLIEEFLQLAEAENLIQQIDTDIIKDIQEGHRVQFEKCAQDLKKIKSEFSQKHFA
jgi:UDP-2,3-diacylglucosamine pyrophosphatase LpxH